MGITSAPETFGLIVDNSSWVILGVPSGGGSMEHCTVVTRIQFLLCNRKQSFSPSHTLLSW